MEGSKQGQFVSLRILGKIDKKNTSKNVRFFNPFFDPPAQVIDLRGYYFPGSIV